MSPTTGREVFEGGGLIKENTLSGVSIIDGSLCAQDMQAFGGPQQGTPEIGTPIVIKKDISAASGSVNIFDADAPYAFQILDVIVQVLAGGNASGEVVLTDGTNDITDAIAMVAVDNVITRAGTIDDAYSTIAAGGSLVAVKNASGDLGQVTVIAVRTA
jgi:hypothetical protein